MRILIIPVTAILLGSLAVWIFSDQLALPEDYDAVVT